MAAELRDLHSIIPIELPIPEVVQMNGKKTLQFHVPENYTGKQLLKFKHKYSAVVKLAKIRAQK